jgi:hypothetical protein
MRNVANTLLDRGSWLGRRAGALNPLTLKIPRNVRSGELPVPRILHGDVRAGDRRGRIEKGESLSMAGSRRSARDPSGHHRLSVVVQRREPIKRAEGFRRKHVRELRLETWPDFNPA